MVSPLCGCFGGSRRQPSPPPSRPTSSTEDANSKNGEVSDSTAQTSQPVSDRGTKASGAVRPQGTQLKNAYNESSISRCPSALVPVPASAQCSELARLTSDVPILGDHDLLASSGLYVAQQAPRAVSAQSTRTATAESVGFPAPAESLTSAKPAPSFVDRGAIPFKSAGQLQAVLCGLVYMGQGASGLVYRASVLQPCGAGAGTTPLPGPVMVAVKFMICNTPHQLWQRSKEALVSKLVSHPNLVRTLAMDVTLVTPNTYQGWSDGVGTSIDAADLAWADAATQAAHTPPTSVAAGMPFGSLWTAGSLAAGGGALDLAAAAAAVSVPAASGAKAAAAVAAAGAEDVTTSDPDNSDTIPAVAEDNSDTVPAVAEEGDVLVHCRWGGILVHSTHPDPPSPALQLAYTLASPPPQPAPECASSSIPAATIPAAVALGSGGGGGPQQQLGPAAAPLPTQPQMERAQELGSGAGGAGQRASKGQSNSPARMLHSVVAAVERGGFADGAGATAAHCSAESEAPCAVDPCELWPGGCGSSVSQYGSKAPSAALDPSGGGGSGGVGGGCGGGVAGDGRGAVLRLQLSSELMRKSGTRVEDGVGGESGSKGGGIDGIACMLSGAGDGERSLYDQQQGAAVVLETEADGAATGAGRGVTAAAAGPAAAADECRTHVSGDYLVSAPKVGGGQSGGGGGGHRSEPVAFQDILYHLEALPGRFLAKVIMEYCDSGTLLSRINGGDYVAHPDKGPLAMLAALRSLLWCLQEVAAGMVHLHSLNIIHGDLKPGNVLLTTQAGSPLGYVCKVSDFGLATALEASEQTITHENWGTVAYMAPESCAGRCRKASDVYSFGVLMWQMCTGERPYAGMQAGQVLLGVKMGTLKLQWPPWINRSLAKVGQACLRFEPKERPGFKGIRSALAKLGARLEHKIVAVGMAGVHVDGQLLAASTLTSVVAMVPPRGCDGVDVGEEAEGVAAVLGPDGLTDVV